MKFTIITPCKNPGQLLDASIASIRENLSSLKSATVEHIVMDGQSSDGTVDKLKQWSREYNLLFRSEQDRSMTQAMNKAIRLGSGDVIGQLNAGDVYLPNALSIVQEVFSSSQADLCFFSGIAMENGMEILHIPKYMKSEIGITLFDCQAYSCSVFYTRSLFDELGGFNEEYPLFQDVEFYVRALRMKKVICIDVRPVAKFLVEKNQLGIQQLHHRRAEAAAVLRFPRLFALSRKLPFGLFLQLTGAIRFRSFSDLLRYYSLRVPEFLKSWSFLENH
jgi:glycosyltransferase involved in cell wall biosynthesis